jgi:hypothetical protein
LGLLWTNFQEVHHLVIKVCDEFKFYDSLLSSNKGRTSAERVAAGLDRAGDKPLPKDAMMRLTAQSGVETVKQAQSDANHPCLLQSAAPQD